MQRELLLVKVRADLPDRSHVLETVQLFRAKVVDVSPDAVTIEATGNSDKLEALLRVLEPFGIRELVQSGMVAVGRGAGRSPTARCGLPELAHDPADPVPPARPTPNQGGAHRGRDVLRRRRRPVVIPSRNVAVIGYGSQGHAHALNLRDSGVDVRVGLPEGSKSRAKAEAEGLRVAHAVRSLRGGRPDHGPRRRTTCSGTSTPRRSSPTWSRATRCFFGHGFNIRFGYIKPPAGVDVAMVAPKGPGHLVRREYVDGRGVPVLVAVEQDATGQRLAARPGLRQGARRAARRRHHARRSPRRPRPTSSASRPCCAAACRAWCRPASRC